MNAVGQLMGFERAQLLTMAAERGLGLRPHLGHDELVAELVSNMLRNGETVTTDGVLAILPEGYGFLRASERNFAPSAIDAYLSQSQVRSLNLQDGQRIRGPLRAPRGSERFFALLHVDDVEGTAPEHLERIAPFDAQLPIVATRPLPLAATDDDVAVLTQLAPWRCGHRVLVHAPATWPRSRWLARVARGLRAGSDATATQLCLLEQRSEDIATARDLVADAGIELASASFGEPPERQLAMAELCWQRAQRLAEHGHDAVLLIDSLTALVRAAGRTGAPSGAWARAGLDARAVLVGKKMFASARQCQGGGSLTVIAAVVAGEPGSLEAAIDDEFLATSNSDVVVAASLVDDGAAVPFDPVATRTRPEDDPTPATAQQALRDLRRELAPLPLAERHRRFFERRRDEVS